MKKPGGDAERTPGKREAPADHEFPEMKFPSARHESYVRYAFDYCRAEGIGLGVMGSLARGDGRPFSDIDLVLGGDVDAGDVRALAEGWERPVMAFFTVNPKGVLTAAYRRGLCVDLGVRKAVSRDEERRVLFLLKDHLMFGPRAEFVDAESFYRPDVLIAHGPLRILYRSLLKYLVGKTEAARALLEEALGPGRKTTGAGFAERAREVLRTIESEMILTKAATAEFDWLIGQTSLETPFP